MEKAQLQEVGAHAADNQKQDSYFWQAPLDNASFVSTNTQDLGFERVSNTDAGRTAFI